MNKQKNIINPLVWSATILLAAVLAACGGGSSGTAATSGNSTSTLPGAGTGLGGAGRGPAPVVLGGAGNFVILQRRLSQTFQPLRSREILESVQPLRV